MKKKSKVHRKKSGAQKKKIIRERVEQLICTRRTPYRERIYSPGEYLSVDPKLEIPSGFMVTKAKSKDGKTIGTGPFYFCLESCSFRGIDFKPGDLWPFPFYSVPPPTNFFAQLEDRSKYEFIRVGNISRAKLRRVKK